MRAWRGGPSAQALFWTDQGSVQVHGPEVTVSSLDGSTTGPANGTKLTTDPLVGTAPTAAALSGLIGA